MPTRRIIPRAAIAKVAIGASVVPLCALGLAAAESACGGSGVAESFCDANADCLFNPSVDAMADARSGRDVIRLNEDASTNGLRDARMVADSAFGDGSDVGTLEGGDVAADAGHEAGRD
jgi:hypothetical protein